MNASEAEAMSKLLKEITALKASLAESEAGAAAMREALTDAMHGIVEAIRMEFGLSQIKGKGLIRQIGKALSSEVGKSFQAEREALNRLVPLTQSMIANMERECHQPLQEIFEAEWFRTARQIVEEVAKLRSTNLGQGAEVKDA